MPQRPMVGVMVSAIVLLMALLVGPFAFGVSFSRDSVARATASVQPTAEAPALLTDRIAGTYDLRSYKSHGVVISGTGTMKMISQDDSYVFHTRLDLRGRPTLRYDGNLTLANGAWYVTVVSTNDPRTTTNRRVRNDLLVGVFQLTFWSDAGQIVVWDRR